MSDDPGLREIIADTWNEIGHVRYARFLAGLGDREAAVRAWRAASLTLHGADADRGGRRPPHWPRT